MRQWLLDHTPLDKTRAARLVFFILRTFFGTWAALIMIIAAHITFLQMIPARWFISVQDAVVSQKNGEPWLTLHRRTRYETPVLLFAELHSASDPSKQYCTYSYSTISEPLAANKVDSPLAKVLPFCRFGQLTPDEHYVIEITYRLELDYGIHKSFGVTTAPFTFDFAAMKAAGREN